MPWSLKAPSVVILDNIHLSDSGTIELMSYLIRNTLSERHAPILFLIGTHSEVDTSAISGIFIRPVDKCSARNCFSIHSVVRPLKNGFFICVSMTRVPYLAQRIHDESKGNPALIEEMLKGLRTKNIISSDYGPLQIPLEHIQGTALPLPHSVRDAIIVRFKALSEEAQELSFLIALSRREALHRGVLNDAIQQLQSQSSVLIDLGHTIEQLIQFGIVQRTGSDQSQYEVKSGWLRDFIVEQIPSEGLGLRHCIIGNALEYAFQHNLSAVIEHLAHHFECGKDCGKAYPYLIEAAEKLKKSNHDE